MSENKRQSKAKLVARYMVPVVLLPGMTFASTVYDRARVVNSHPVYETVSYDVPVRECRTERVAYPQSRHHSRSATGPILGAIIGGALGNAVGHKKRNKQVGTVVGAVLGGSIGVDLSRRHGEYSKERVEYRAEEVCNVVNEVRREERLTGYDVTYVYGGKTYNTIMPHDPGKHLRVRVRVSPAE